MAMNRVQFSERIVSPRFHTAFWHRRAVRYGPGIRSLSGRLPLPSVRWYPAFRSEKRLAQDVSVQSLSPPDFVGCRAPLSRDPLAPDALVSGDLPDQPGENRVVRIGAEALTRRTHGPAASATPATAGFHAIFPHSARQGLIVQINRQGLQSGRCAQGNQFDPLTLG